MELPSEEGCIQRNEAYYCDSVVTGGRQEGECENLSALGKPWPKFLVLAEKSLGSRTHRFASESPGNDQFSLTPLESNDTSQTRVSLVVVLPKKELEFAAESEQLSHSRNMTLLMKKS